MGTSFLSGWQNGRSVKLTTYHFLPVPTLRMGGIIPLITLYAFTEWTPSAYVYEYHMKEEVSHKHLPDFTALYLIISIRYTRVSPPVGTWGPARFDLMVLK